MKCVRTRYVRGYECVVRGVYNYIKMWASVVRYFKHREYFSETSMYISSFSHTTPLLTA